MTTLQSLLGLESGKCVSPDQAVQLVFGLAAVVLGSTLVLASWSSGQPLHQLGQRPKGTGLWSWLFHHLRDDVGVTGYDSILGSLSPQLRLSFHVGLAISWWAALLTLWPTIMTLLLETYVSTTGGGRVAMKHVCLNGIDLNVWQSGLTALVMYGVAAWRIANMTGVSVPGGPRPKKIQRQPKWENVAHNLSDDTVKGELWKCLVADESHKDTLAKFQSKSLTGEAAGRQIWSSACAPDNDKTSNRKINEEEVQTMARGGRPTFGSFNASVNPNSCDMIFRAQQIRSYLAKGGQAPPLNGKRTNKTVKEAVKQATHFYSMLQTDDGHWAGDYGGPHFLMPGLVTAWYMMGKPEQFLNNDQVELLKHYILVHQQSDGGWGTHIESPSTMFGSTLMYVAMRLLGVEKDHHASVKGRKFLQDNGGALMTASWSKFYLCLLGLMDWKGHNSVPCEMWLLPNWFPFHPGRMWCHARMVYLPMGYLYGCRVVYERAETDPLILSLREELYCQQYNTIPWTKTRHWVAEMDNYSPIPWFMKTLQNILARYENWSIFQRFKNYVRQYGLAFSLEYMHAEDLQTNYIDIGPVNKVLNMISMYHSSGNDLKDDEVVKHMMRVQDYLWIAEDGMKMQGYNGSQWCVQYLSDRLGVLGLPFLVQN